MVCCHKPVFDTLSMLAGHRQGKKHAASDEIFVMKKKELKALILKRKHEQYLKDGSTTIKQAAARSPGASLAGKPLDPGVRQRGKPYNRKPYDRKLCVDLVSHDASSSLQAQSPPSSFASNSQAFPNARKHGHQLKNIFRTGQRGGEPVRAYVRRSQAPTDRGESFQPPPVSHGAPSVCPTDQGVPQTTLHEGLQCSASFSSPAGSSSSLSSSSLSSSSCHFTGVPDTPFPAARCPHHSAGSRALLPPGLAWSGGGGGGRGGSTLTGPYPSSPSPRTGCGGDGASGAREDGVGMTSGAPHAVQATDQAGGGGGGGSGAGPSSLHTAERKKLAQKYYHLGGSGWKKDWDGKWIRDEEAEFDSDEEPPHLP
ncbi:hypothetical protein ACOMHN_058529 [Nucella lapillus]